MAVSHIRMGKTETRELAERERLEALRLGDVEPWRMSDGTFFTVLLVIAALLAVLAIALR